MGWVGVGWVCVEKGAAGVDLDHLFLSGPKVHSILQRGQVEGLVHRVLSPNGPNVVDFVQYILYRTMLSRYRNVVVGGHVFEMGNRWGEGKGDGKEGGGEVSIQPTRDLSGRDRTMTQRRDSK
jgi:hypothetical protein